MNCDNKSRDVKIPTLLILVYVPTCLHVPADRIPKLRAFHFFRIGHQAGEIIGDRLRRDGALIAVAPRTEAIHGWDEKITDFRN